MLERLRNPVFQGGLPEVGFVFTEVDWGEILPEWKAGELRKACRLFVCVRPRPGSIHEALFAVACGGRLYLMPDLFLADWLGEREKAHWSAIEYYEDCIRAFFRCFFGSNTRREGL
jgi:hypothetical protein